MDEEHEKLLELQKFIADYTLSRGYKPTTFNIVMQLQNIVAITKKAINLNELVWVCEHGAYSLHKFKGYDHIFSELKSLRYEKAVYEVKQEHVYILLDALYKYDGYLEASFINLL